MKAADTIVWIGVLVLGARRLMLEKVQTPPGEITTRTFTVNVRYRELKTGQQVRLKPRELDNLDWGHKLTLEFNGTRPSVPAVDITKVDDAITVYLAGDSTVVDQDKEPWAAWGKAFVGERISSHLRPTRSSQTLYQSRARKRSRARSRDIDEPTDVRFRRQGQQLAGRLS